MKYKVPDMVLNRGCGSRDEHDIPLTRSTLIRGDLTEENLWASLYSLHELIQVTASTMASEAMSPVLEMMVTVHDAMAWSALDNAVRGDTDIWKGGQQGYASRKLSHLLRLPANRLRGRVCAAYGQREIDHSVPHQRGL